MPEQKNFSWLLIALLVFLVGTPVADALGQMGAPVTRALTFSWLLAVGVWSLRGFGRLFPAGIALAVAGILLSIMAAKSPASGYAVASMAATTGFLLLAVWCTSSQVVRGNEISGNRLVGAVSLYLLLGVLWAVCYATVELLSAESFAGDLATGPNGWGSDWLYLSFVTMTTLGYGDITPVSSIARVLAYMQALVGQFYIAILVAGLVSAYISQRDTP